MEEDLYASLPRPSRRVGRGNLIFPWLYIQPNWNLDSTLEIESGGRKLRASFGRNVACLSLLLSLLALYFAWQARNVRLEGQVETMSRILNVIVPKLLESGESEYGQLVDETSAADKQFQKAIIRVDRANLRKEGNKDAPVIMTLGRGSELLVSGAGNGWYSTFTPTGEIAWISAEVVRIVED